MVSELELGKAIQNARKAAGLTQQELCQRAGLSYSTLAKIERGAIKSPSVFTVTAVAQSIGITIEALLGVGQPNPGGSAVLPQLKRSKSGITFVYFDINGVLVRFFQRAFTELATESHVSPDKVESIFWHYNDAVCRGDMPTEDFNKTFADLLRIEKLDWQKYYLSAVDAIDEMQECVAWASEHYKVGLLSNIFPGFIDVMLKNGLLPDVPYSAVIDSSEVGAIKPEQHIYEAAQAIAGVPPQQILFIDDSRTNLMAAERLGWHVLWFDDFRPAESVSRIKIALEF